MLKIIDILNKKNAISRTQGLKLYNILIELNPSEISFEGIERVSTAFLNASIGKLYYSGKIQSSDVNYIYSDVNTIIEEKVNDVIENALLGDKYDELVGSLTL